VLFHTNPVKTLYNGKGPMEHGVHREVRSEFFLVEVVTFTPKFICVIGYVPRVECFVFSTIESPAEFDQGSVVYFCAAFATLP
jgi:hypothetical protein